jgi:hypothetical protein
MEIAISRNIKGIIKGFMGMDKVGEKIVGGRG